MPLTNAEKQKRYRERRDKDPNRRAEHLAKCREKYRQDIVIGKRKLISDLTPREQRQQRKHWKKMKSEQRKRKKETLENINRVITPPSSPQTSGLDHHSTKRKKRRIAKCYRDNAKLQEELEKQKRITQKLRMRLFRMRKTNGPDTPKTKTRKLLRHWKTENGKTARYQSRALKAAAKRTLIFQFALTDELCAKYKQLQKGKKKCIAEVLKGNILRKYKLTAKASKILSIAGGRSRTKKGSLTARLKSKVTSFYERDDVSRMTSGIKETVTRHGRKMQKRILTDKLNSLYEKFMLENTSLNISYSSFTRLRPFWVKPARESDRETCACKIHENMQFIVSALYSKKILESDSLENTVKLFACDISNMQCMYGNCLKCKDLRLPEKTIDQTEEVTWLQWQTKKEERYVRGEPKEVTMTVKASVADSVGGLVDKFYSEMQRFKIHTFNIMNQLKHYRRVKETLQPNEALVHIDFAENFQGRLAKEIQSMHFGASKTQITLHTGVYYTHNRYQTFCSVSDCLDHNPSSVWALIDPVLDDMLDENKNIDTIHFFSDGPSTQYRQKGNFYLLTKAMADRKLKATWNFHECGHGKGVPDGVGGALKRTANELALHGRDIIDAASFVENIRERESTVKLYEVSPAAVSTKVEILNSVVLKPVPGTFKLHQLKTSDIGTIFHRQISCNCDGDHIGHKWHHANLLQKSEFDNSLSKCKLENSVAKTDDDTKRCFFTKSLNTLQTCETFGDVEKTCTEIIQDMRSLGYDNHGNIPTRTVQEIDATVDEYSKKIFPKDVSDEILPVVVTADGNCLPGTGSMHAYGNDKQAEEMRVKIIVEATKNKQSYLDHEYLLRGHQTSSRNLPKIYAMYSDEYTPGERLTDKKIETIYEKEILKIRKNKTYMGIWQVFALTSVLMSPVFSIYPNLGNPHVRKDLHRLILPRVEKYTNVRHLMWTTTREDMRPRHWVPNHFVAAFPLTDAPNDLKPKDIKNVQKSSSKTEINESTHENELKSTDSKCLKNINADNENEQRITEDKNNNNMSSDITTLETGVDNGKSNVSCTSDSRNKGISDVSSLSPENLLGKYVLIQYENQPYPGLVVDSDDSEVYVRCMHRVGRTLNSCSWYWPKAVRDECWYSMADVLEVIQEPTIQGRNYYVDSQILLNYTPK